ncbi:hypothetical protein FGE12_00295 [Aggregicoccus sp. 17bor-14]|uniref:hypothetical protein n=1 Tax=Myxococcaceae TaxID=31 RepID=UPI00129C8340|nr:MULTISPECIES: hypothetical protein [Myxococcaceae]MBF5040814.1 hypothetical protein [Simulacricoccus sp. 17bor-14]MRI86602.1 hypothetical protein [Aggregicoccus sp. 17bor-14]
MRALLLCAALAVVSGCASHTALAPDERASIEKELSGAPRYLKLSFNVTPFFGDAGHRLLTPAAPDEVRLLDDTRGEPINPGAVEAVLPAGRRARIVKVEFPTAWAVAERVLYSPRVQTWVYVDVEGAPPGPPLVLVLPPRTDTADAVRTEVERYLIERDPSAQLAALSAPVREAVFRKEARVGMSEEALEMAWGYPERRVRSYQDGVRSEEWVYPGGRRKAFLTEGRVARLEGAS